VYLDLKFRTEATVFATSDLEVYVACDGPGNKTLGFRPIGKLSNFAIVGTHHQISLSASEESHLVSLLTAGDFPLRGQNMTGFDGIVTPNATKVTYHVALAVLDAISGCRVVGQVTY
jgi:hypothetical protein